MTRTFRKTGSPSAIATEVHSLRWLAAASSNGGAAVAELVDHGDSWLTTHMLDAARPSPDDAREFGRRLAMTHAAGAGWFGAVPPGLETGQAVLAELPSPSLVNPLYSSWGAFFAELRLLPYLEMARDRGALTEQETRRLSRLIDRVADGAFDAAQPAAVREAHRRTSPAAVPVARLHGDLWSGNVVWAVGQGRVTGTLIDPSAHGGHAETDLAELSLFGSPHLTETLRGYQEVSPLADGWTERAPLHQLHMLLVHVVLFGGGYVAQTMEAVEALA